MATTPIHKHLIIRAEVTDPPGKDDIQRMIDWTTELIDEIDMNLLDGPFCKYVDIEGNSGLTVVAIIETSHIAMHVWDEASPALMQLDVYTCGPFKPILVFEKLRDFGLTKLEWKYLDRETKLKLEHIGQWENPAKGTGWESLREAQLPNHATLNNG